MSTFPKAQVTPRTVDEYLRKLKLALEGAPPAMIQDALADAEDYLREEVALDPYKPESEIVARVTRSFGRPEEVAAEYRNVEIRFERRNSTGRSARAGRGFFGIALDPKAYGGLLYALLALPIGVIYFTWVVAGISMSAGFAILIIGVPFTLLFVASIRFMALMEGRIVEALLGQRMPRRLPSDEKVTGMWPRIRAMLSDPRTWSTMFYMILQLPLGITYFVIAVVGMTLSLALVANPFLLAAGIHAFHFGNSGLTDFATSPGGMILFAMIGFVLFFLILHALRGLTWLHARYAEATLVRV